MADSNKPPMVRLSLRIADEPFAVEVAQPPNPARLDELLPLMRAIDDAAVAQAVRRTTVAGKTVSCRKGCSACCQATPVMVTPPEAYALLRLVEAMPEPRQAELRRRFADRVARLRDAGLVEICLQRDPGLDKAETQAMIERYFRLRLVCPFLDDDACSIYEDRPFVCRQFLVTSPASMCAAMCADPFHNPVQVVPLSIAAAKATLQVVEEALATPQCSIPLVLALDYAEAHRTELERTYPAEDVARRWVKAICDGSGADESLDATI